MQESQDLSDIELAAIYNWPETRTYRLNMILDSLDSSTGYDFTSVSLTSPEDRRILKMIRAQAHVVIFGASSIRAEGWFLPPRGRLAVLSHSGELPWESCPDASRVNVYPSVSALVHSITDSEKNVLCEGGLSVAQQIAERIGFDEIALSRVGNSDELQIPRSLTSENKYELVSRLHDRLNDVTFQFWRRAVEQC
jgi:riboflavin biosynthesis pyrimidine reductase